MNIETIIKPEVRRALKELYQADVNEDNLQLQKTRREFKGDITIVVFPLVKYSKRPPEQTAEELGTFLLEALEDVSEFNVIKGFLNLVISPQFWLQYIREIGKTGRLFEEDYQADQKEVMIEYSSPNTNKPLHLGHIRNNLIGYSLSKIIEASGRKVIKVNLVNDRGIHICKSMLAWQKWGNGETPESSGKKGDHLVGDYYVKFDQEFKKQISSLVAEGMSTDEASRKAPLILEAQEMLRKWEAGDPVTVDLWETMNGWVYKGFDETYNRLGVSFDKIYYESQTYKQGKSIVLKGLEDGVLYRREDNSVWANLNDEGLDEKLLLRSDGTSVYMTQDIGTAAQRFNEYDIDEIIYVVGNEQNYHFQVLSIVMDKLGFPWAENLHHLSYGMVELPEGKMKSREGTVVDADDLIDEMIATARDMSDELGKLDGYSDKEKEQIYRIIGLGALKYFILKVDPRKNMTFNPRESIDFNGNTGPFVQYTAARIKSVLRKALEQGLDIPNTTGMNFTMNEKEIELVKLIYDFDKTVYEAARSYTPAMIANYVYELAKEYNQFYHDYSILKEENFHVRDFRIMLSSLVVNVISTALSLLGIETPERM